MLEIPSDRFELRFVSDGSNTKWGYRLVVWAHGPPHWCRLSELMLHDAKDADRLCRHLMRQSARLAAFGGREMVELALSTAADNSKDARAALAVLQRTGAEPTDRMCDALLRPNVAEGTTPWEKLLLENACPKLNERLVRSPRLLVATQSLNLLLKTLVPKRRSAAIALMRYQRALPDGLHTALVTPMERGGSKWQALVRDEECHGLVKMLLAKEPALMTPALIAALAPGFTYFYDVRATTPRPRLDRVSTACPSSSLSCAAGTGSMPPCRRAAVPPYRRAALPPCRPATLLHAPCFA